MMNIIKPIMTLVRMNSQEWLRQKFFQIVVVLGLLFLGFSYILASLSFVEQTRIALDIGLGVLEVVSVVIAAVIGTHSLQKDTQRRTIQVLLARPVPRWYIVMGYIGAIKVLNYLLILGLGLVIYFTQAPAGTGFNLTISLFTILLKSILIAAFGLMLSMRSNAILALVLTLAFWVLCYSVPDFGFFAEKSKSSVLLAIYQMFKIFIPKFYLFNWKDYHFLISNVSLESVLWSWFHCVGWILFLLLVASLLFRKKELL